MVLQYYNVRDNITSEVQKMSNREYLEKIIELLEAKVDDNTAGSRDIFEFIYKLLIRM